MSLRALSGERSFTVVAAAFDDLRTAKRAAIEAASMLGGDGDVVLVRPGENLVERAPAPDSRGIGVTLIRSHVALVCGGVVVGVLAALALIVDGSPAMTAAPAMLAFLGGVMGASTGLLAAGLWTLRPDHGAVLARMEERLDLGQFAVVLRPVNEQQTKHACRSLRRAGGATFRSL